MLNSIYDWYYFVTQSQNIKGTGSFTQLSATATPGRRYSFVAKDTAGSYVTYQYYYRVLLAGRQ